MEKNTVTAKTLHAQLRDIVAAEIEQLPAQLQVLEPHERVRAIIQLLPYVSPKMETAAADYGENIGGWNEP